MSKPTYEELEATLERVQLAARVKALEAQLEEQDAWQSDDRQRMTRLCTPEERKVLEAMADYPDYILEDWKREGTPRRKALAEAELANRAAKAKREDK